PRVHRAGRGTDPRLRLAQPSCRSGTAGGGRDAAGIAHCGAGGRATEIHKGKDEIEDMKCGVRNAECGIARGVRSSMAALDWTLARTIPHSAFRIPHSCDKFHNLPPAPPWPPIQFSAPAS